MTSSPLRYLRLIDGGRSRLDEAGLGSKPQLGWEGIVGIVAVLVGWEIASASLPPFLFPPLGAIGAAIARLAIDPDAATAVILTYARIVAWLTATFALATALGISAALHPRLDRALLPLIQLKQGVPGVCWAIFAIIWFQGIEARIAFVVIVSTIPSFFFQARDGFQAIPNDLWQMMHALRPTHGQMFAKLVLPAMLPAFLTAWRINLGNGARITITAELLAGISGIGFHLRNAQEQFRMDEVLAWTAAIAAFVLLTDLGMARLERAWLAWRPAKETSR